MIFSPMMLRSASMPGALKPDGAFNHTKGMALIDGYQSVRPLESREAKALAIARPGRCPAFLPHAPA
jgi:Ser/Thr protein kinase RdoA (MazF antagonist)